MTWHTEHALEPDEQAPPATQAESIIRKFGGPLNLAEALGVQPSTVYRWTYPTDKYGTGGWIPVRNHKAIKDAARREGILLRARDWFPGDMP